MSRKRQHFLSRFWHWEYLVLGLPLVLFVVLRVPSLFESYWYGDEGIYAAVAQEMSRGKLLYRDTWDHKPPLIFLIFYPAALVGWSVGFPLLKLANLLWGALSVLIVNKILKERVGKLPRFFGLVLLSILLGSTVLEGNAVNSEVVFITFNLLVLYFVLSEKRFALAGLLAFLSLFTKVPGFVEAAGIMGVYVAWLVIEKGYSRAARAAALFAAGVLVPLFLVITYFYAHGALLDFIDANLLFNTSYSLGEHANVSVFGAELPMSHINATGAGAIFLASAYMYKIKRISKFGFFVANLVSLQVFASLLSGRNYPHYFLQTVTGFALLLALTLERLKGKIALSAASAYLFLALLFVPMAVSFRWLGGIPVYASPAEYYPAFVREYLFSDYEPESAFEWGARGPKVARVIRVSEQLARNYQDNDKVFIYTSKPWIVALAERNYTNKFVTWFHFSYRDSHGHEGLNNIREADLFVLDKEITLLEPFRALLELEFEKIGDYEHFEIYKKK